MSGSIEIVVCTGCRGTGYIIEHKTTCYHRGEYDVIKHQCGVCEGSGRQKKTTTVKMEPYKP